VSPDALKILMDKLEKHYKDSTELFPDPSVIREIEVIPSTSAIINAVTGVGGIPRGRATELYGPEGSGKTTLAIDFCANTQRLSSESRVLYVDYEHAIDLAYARALGVDLHTDRFVLCQPEYGEQGAEVIKTFVKEGLVDLVVIDSAAAMTPRSELEGSLDEDGGTQKGTQSAMMARFMSTVTKFLGQGRKPALLIVNQTRAAFTIGGRRGGSDASGRPTSQIKEKAAGGKALKFYTSMRVELEVTRAEGDEARGSKGTDQVYTGNRIRIFTIKNKLAPPWIRGEFNIQFGIGIDNIGSIAELAEARLGIMAGAGFFRYTGDTPETSLSCRGREAFRDMLTKNPDLLAELERKVLEDIRDEHAKKLGLDRITVQGKAKEIESDPGTITLVSEQTGGDEELSKVGTNSTEKYDGPGLPTVDE